MKIVKNIISTVFAILPMALALGAGSESRVSMGIAVIGGLLIGTLISLFVVPAMYIFITSKKRVVIKEEDYLGT